MTTPEPRSGVGARALVLAVAGYQRLVSPLLGQRCRFWPSCSEYLRQAVEAHGALRGTYLGVRRILRCHPWSPGGVDRVPSTFSIHGVRATEVLSAEHSHGATTPPDRRGT